MSTPTLPTATGLDPALPIFVAGHRGLVGGAVVRALLSQGHRALLTRGREELDLGDEAAVERFFADARPQAVVLAAAKVGGILANDRQPAEFIRENLRIQTHVIHQAWKHGVRRLLFLGSSCIYPRDCAQPIREDALFTGPLEPTNSAYAMAKIAGIEMCRAYNRQYGTQYLCAMPTNLYGPGDNYHPEHSHVLPALIRKFDTAVREGHEAVTIWGSGRPLREFLYSDDLAQACLHLLALPEAGLQQFLDSRRYPLVNIGYGSDVSIAELATLVAEVCGFRGRLEFDRSKPDGTPRKLLDSSLIRALGWAPTVDLRQGIERALADYRQRHGG